MTDLGTDFSNLTDLTATFALVSGPRGVAEALYRRFITPAGSVWYDTEYESLDVRDELGGASSSAQRAALAARMQHLGLADDRIDALRVTITAEASGLDASITIACEGLTAGGPFRLVMAASPELVTLLALSPS